jgi:hypothetical protein
VVDLTLFASFLPGKSPPCSRKEKRKACKLQEKAVQIHEIRFFNRPHAKVKWVPEVKFPNPKNTIAEP